jgi:hypothetical protein
MSTYSTISDDYKMFETKAPVDYHDDISNYVSVEDMMNHMFKVLVEYDRCMSEKQEATVNPMSGRVMMRMQNGLSFELPENIQRIAIAKYLETKNQKKDVQKCVKSVKSLSQKLEKFEDISGFEGFQIEHNENVTAAADATGEPVEEQVEEQVEEPVEEPVEEAAEEPENEKKVEEFSECYNKIKKMVSPKLQKNNMTTIITIILVLLILYALYKYFCEENRPNF